MAATKAVARDLNHGLFYMEGGGLGGMMGQAKRAKNRAQPIAANNDTPDRLGPTEAQVARAQFVEVEVQEKRPGKTTLKLGRAWQRRPMIDILAAQGWLSDAETKALRRYRHHADIADRSPLKDSLGKLVRIDGGSGTGPTIEVLNATAVVRACERAAGSLAGILRAVVVYDQSLSQWAIGRAGAIEKCRDRKGKRVCTIEATPKALDIARLDIRMAAKRVQAELDA